MSGMAMTLEKFRKLVAIDPNDPLSRFALGKKLFEEDRSPAALEEARGHLAFANERSPEHLATYHIMGQVLLLLDRKDDARQVLEEGVRRVAGVGEGMGRDLGPAMVDMLAQL